MKRIGKKEVNRLILESYRAGRVDKYIFDGPSLSVAQRRSKRLIFRRAKTIITFNNYEDFVEGWTELQDCVFNGEVTIAYNPFSGVREILEIE